MKFGRRFEIKPETLHPKVPHDLVTDPTPR